jgi:hypothetical protein
MATSTGWREGKSANVGSGVVPKGPKDSAWGFNPRYRFKNAARPEGAVDRFCEGTQMKNEAFIPNIFRPFSIPNPHPRVQFGLGAGLEHAGQPKFEDEDDDEAPCEGGSSCGCVPAVKTPG